VSQNPPAASVDVDLTESNTAAIGVGMAPVGSTASSSSSGAASRSNSEGSDRGVGLTATLRRKGSRMSAVLQASFPLSQLANSSNTAQLGSIQSMDLDEPVTTAEAVTALIITLVDCSVVLLPRMMANVGYVPAPIWMLAAGFATFECGLLIAEACDHVERRHNIVINSYEALAKQALGPISAVLLGIIKNLALMGFVVVYMQLAVETIVNLAKGEKTTRFGESEGLIRQAIQTKVRFFMVLPAFLAIAFVRSVKQVARIAVFSSFAVAVVVGSVVVACIWRSMLIPVCDTSMPLPWFNCRDYTAWAGRFITLGKPWVEQGQAIAFFFFLYAGLSTVPTLRARLQDKSKMPKVLRISFGLTTVLFLSIMCVGYWGWGNLAHENTLLGLSEAIPMFPLLGLCGKECLLVSIFCASPVYTHCIFSSMEGACSGKAADPASRLNTFLRFVLLSILVCITHIVPFVVQVSGLISSVFIVFTDLLFPLLIYYSSVSSLPEARFSPRMLLHAALLVFASMVLVMGFHGSWSSLQYQLKSKSFEER